MEEVEGLFVLMFYHVGFCSEVVGPYDYEDIIYYYHKAVENGEDVKIAKLTFLD